MDAEEYKAWLEKFDNKYTTDECFTPPNIYNAVVDYCKSHYKINNLEIIRPFYPNGDYKKENYENKIVIDNPPFSILKSIVDFYTSNSIPFFLFCDARYANQYIKNKDVCVIVTQVGVIYENGVNVSTSFITNLEQGTAIKVDGVLYNKLKAIQKTKEGMQKVKYPKNVFSCPLLGPIAKQGIIFEIKNNELQYISNLNGRRLYGGGFITTDEVSERIIKKRKEEYEREELTEEKYIKIVEELNKNGRNKRG